MLNNILKTFIDDGSISIKLDITPKPTDLYIVALSTKEIHDTEEWLKTLDKHAEFRQKLKKMTAFAKISSPLTTLKSVTPGTYFCYLFSSVKNDHAQVNKECMHKVVKIESKKNAVVNFDLDKNEAMVKISVRNGSTLVAGADVYIQGLPNALVSKANKEITVFLKPGRYGVTAIYQGKKIQSSLSFTDLAEQVVHLDFNS